jgi:hypothetical protein
MYLRAGRVKSLVRDALQQGSQGVICHQTLSNGDRLEFGGALCRWFYDTYGFQNNFIRVMERLGGFAEVALPEDEEKMSDDG